MLKSLFPWKHHKTKEMAAQQTMEVAVPEDHTIDQPLLPCHVCGRTFLPAPLKKHERVCERSVTKKRKPFDSLKQRVEGTDLANFHQKTYLKKPEPATTPDPKRKRQSNWKEKHLELVNTIRAAKGVPTPNMSSAKARSSTSLMVGNERCPSCDRQFGPKAYDRHVEWCKEKKAQQRIHQSPANVLRAKERLEARTKYVPPLNKSKKTAVREKYSNQNTSTETLASIKTTSSLSRGASIRKPRSEVNLGRNSDKASVNGDREKTRVDNCIASRGDKLKRQESLAEKHTPVIASKTEPGKNSQKKRITPYMKINNTDVNHVDGISVASLKFDYANKKMVTWRDTVGNSSESDNFPRKSDPKVKNSRGNCNSTQSVNAVLPETERISCEKILSSSDVLHKDMKIPLTKHVFSKKINTTVNDPADERKMTSNDVKVAQTSKRTDGTKNYDEKKIKKKSGTKKNANIEEDSIDMSPKEPDPTFVSMNNKIKYPLPLSKKSFAKKINETRRSFVNNEEIDVENCASPSRVTSEETTPDLLKNTMCGKKTVDEASSRASDEYSKSNRKVLERPAHLLKSTFTKKLNSNKYDKKTVKNEMCDVAISSKNSDTVTPSTFDTNSQPGAVNVDLLYENNFTNKLINTLNLTDSSGGNNDANFQINKSINPNAKSGSKFDVTSEHNGGDDAAFLIASKESENSIFSNCSTVNSEETYLVNISSTDEFNYSQSFGNNNIALDDSSTNSIDVTTSYKIEPKTDFMTKKIVPTDTKDERPDSLLDTSSSVTVNSSVLDIQNCSRSCNSVTEAFEKLTLNSREKLRDSDQKLNIDDKSKGEEENGNGCKESGQSPLEDATTFDSFRNTHREFTDWFEEYMKKNEHDEENLDDEVEYPPQKEIEDVEDTEKKSENLVLLFKSTTSLDLTAGVIRDRTDRKTATGDMKLNKRISEESLNSSCELDSFDLDLNKSSNFSLKKSLSHIDITTTSSFLGLSSKNTLISIYNNKNRENFDIESVSETRRTRTSSLPNIHLFGICRKPEMRRDIEVNLDENSTRPENRNIVSRYDVLDERENLRREILGLAAEEFIEDCRRDELDDAEEIGNVNNVLYGFPEEEYTVPKKKRKVDCCIKTRKVANSRFAPFANAGFDLRKLKAITLSEGDKRDQGIFDENAMGDFVKKKDATESSARNANLDSLKCPAVETKPKEPDKSSASSARTTISTECSPRLVTILDKVLNNTNPDSNPENSKALIVVTLSDCMKLVDLDRKKLPKIKKCLEKIKEKHKIDYGEVKLPSIENREREDKEIQAVLGEEENKHLPKIMDKFIRRGTLKKCTMNVKTNVKDVYLEYNESNSFSYDPFESAQRQFMELLDCDDFKSLVAPTSTPVKHTPRPHTTSGITPTIQQSPTVKKKIKSAEPVLSKVTKNNRASVIDPPMSFKDSLDSITDDFELMETLIKHQFTDANKNADSFYLHSKPAKESLTLSDILDNRKYSDDMTSIDPRLINENDNLSIPEHFKMDDFSPTSTTDTDITLQNDVDHYSLQYDNKIAAFEPTPDKKSTEKKSAIERKPVVKRSTSLVSRTKTDEGSLRVTSKKLTTKSKLTSRSNSSVATNKATSGEKKKGLSTLKKSTTLFPDPVPKPPSLKNKNDVNNYFSEKQQRNLGVDRTSPEKELSDTVQEALKPGDLFTVDDEMYEEYKKYEEMYLKEKAQSSTKKKHKPKLIDINFGILTASEEEEHLTFNNKISNDSAYGSLTRKTPKHRSRATKLTPVEQKQVDSTSSSGSEHCPSSPAVAQRISKFCHECGNKYPLSTAKFCVECGVKRLVL